MREREGGSEGEKGREGEKRDERRYKKGWSRAAR